MAVLASASLLPLKTFLNPVFKLMTILKVVAYFCDNIAFRRGNPTWNGNHDVGTEC